MNYQIVIDRKALKELQKGFSVQERRRIVKAIRMLAHDPRPPQSKKLVGAGSNYRLRVGENRIVYSIDDKNHLILIHKIKSRGSSTLYLI